MKNCFKILWAITFVFLILFVVGCGDKEDESVDESGKDTTIADIAFVLVKAGMFTMGSPYYESGRYYDEIPHKITLTKDYWISKYPITQRQYQKVMGDNPSYFSGDNRPVEKVNWAKADDFARRIGGRLPTEAEWEFAARGGNKSKGYIYSGSDNIEIVAWYGGISEQETHPVGELAPNELGICDMSGNVWEWCGDRFEDYTADAVTDPAGPATGGNGYVVRGGSWYNGAPDCRIANRGGFDPLWGYDNLGFRVAFPRK